uniref:Uncharacterized protein n=1 Tax=Hyaloperonospora arabidopsidis (strain Emoy2) TaxID=559515 RepID=M4BKR7_HYAAE
MAKKLLRPKGRRPGGERRGQGRTKEHADKAAGSPHRPYKAHGAHGGVARATEEEGAFEGPQG